MTSKRSIRCHATPPAIAEGADENNLVNSLSVPTRSPNSLVQPRHAVKVGRTLDKALRATRFPEPVNLAEFSSPIKGLEIMLKLENWLSLWTLSGLNCLNLHVVDICQHLEITIPCQTSLTNTLLPPCTRGGLAAGASMTTALYRALPIFGGVLTPEEGVPCWCKSNRRHRFV